MSWEPHPGQCPVCFNYSSDPETGTCPRCNPLCKTCGKRYHARSGPDAWERKCPRCWSRYGRILDDTIIDPDEPLIPPLTDVNTPDGVLYRWYRLIPDGFDLYPEAIGNNEIGDPPKWLEHQEDVTDLDTSLSPGWCHGLHRGHEFTERWLRWALRKGIAPGTPFLVRIGEPEWYKCSYEYNEWDCEYDVEVVWVQPRTPEQSLKSWARFLDAMIRGRDAHCDALDKLKHLRETDESALSIRTDWYYANGYYDEMSPPNGLSVQLWTSHTLHGNKHPMGAQLAVGRSDRGDYQEAFRNLLKTCAERYPQLKPLAILQAKGSDRRINLTRYERINLDLT